MDHTPTVPIYYRTIPTNLTRGCLRSYSWDVMDHTPTVPIYYRTIPTNLTCACLRCYSWDVMDRTPTVPIYYRTIPTNLTCGCLRCYSWDIMDHTHPQSLSIARGKKQPAGKWLATDVNIRHGVTSWLQTLDTDFFSARVQALKPQWDTCLTVNGNYREV